MITCSTNPMTGYFRNGCCDTDKSDIGLHTVCVIVTKEFLTFSKLVGNDLSTPMRTIISQGLKEGIFMCLNGTYENGVAPKVILEATNEKTLKYVKIEDLIKHSYKQ